MIYNNNNNATPDVCTNCYRMDNEDINVKSPYTNIVFIYTSKCSYIK